MAYACERCGTFFTTGEVAPSYHDDYWSEPQRDAAGAWTDLRNRERLAHFERNAGPVRGRKVLELGAGQGDYVHLLVQAGARVEALEPDPKMASAVTRSTGAPCASGFLEDFQPGSTFGVVNLSHVLEHLADPLSGLKRIRPWLAVGGVLAVEVPNADVLAHGRLSSFFFDESSHRFHFTSGGLVGLLRLSGYQPFALEPAFTNHWGPETATRVLARISAQGEGWVPAPGLRRRALAEQLRWTIYRQHMRAARHLVGNVARAVLPGRIVRVVKDGLDRRRCS